MPVTFYMWIDEISMQLCFNFISGQNPVLPFRCRLNIVPDRSIIFTQFLASVIKGGLINYDEITFFEKDDPRLDEIEDEDSSQNYLLDVYVVVLNEQEEIQGTELQDIEEQTVIDRKFSYELMQIFLDNYCQNNFNQDLITLVQNSRFQDKNRNFVMPNIIEPRIWQIWQQIIYRIILQEESKVLNLVIAFYSMLYFLANYFDEFIDSVDENRMTVFKDIILEFVLDKDNKPINQSFWNDWVSAVEQLNAKNKEQLHHTVSINTPISQDVACKIIQVWLEYKKEAIDIDAVQKILADTQGMQQAIDEIKQQQRSYLLLDND